MNDDLVIKPKIVRQPGDTGGSGPASTPATKTLSAHRMRARLAQRLLRIARVNMGRALTLAGRGGGGGLRGLRGAGRVAGGAYALAIAAAVVARFMTGRTFENMGENIRASTFGDSDLRVTAATRARGSIEGDDALMAAINRDGIGPTTQFLYDQAYRVALAEEKGRSAIMTDPRFQVNNDADMLLLNSREGAKIIVDKIEAAFRAAGGGKKLDEIKRLASPAQRR